MKERNFKRCGAKTRKPGNPPCKNWPMKNKRRCRMHGGKNPGAPRGNQNALKHGGYSRVIRDSERELYDQIQVGTLDDEIKFCKLLLARIGEAQKEFEETSLRKEGEDLEDIEIEDIEGMPDGKKFETLMNLIIRLSGRVGDLESARAELIRDIGKGRR